jgi:hypothetical protein
MAGEHHNIFFYYRGQVRAPSSAEAEELREQQAEDNTTKALINLLHWSEDELTTSFAECFLPGHPGVGAGPGGYGYFLQGGPPDTPAERWLLAISQAPAALQPSDTDGEVGSRVDAAFAAAGELLVVFEVKLGEERDEAQLARHRERWGIPVEHTVPVAWSAVYEWAGRALEGAEEPVTRFLLTQFREYLSICGLKPFVGLEDRDFGFFEDPSGEQQPEVKAQLASLWREVYALLPTPARRSLGEVHVGQLGPTDHAWAQTHKKERKVNLTLEISSESLQLNLVAWLERPAQRMLEWLRSADARALARFDGYDLVLYRRRAGNYEQRANGPRPWWQRESSSELGRLRAGADAAELAALLAQADDWESGWEKPAFHLRRTWSRAEAVEAGMALVAAVGGEVERLLPLLEELNG